MGRPALLDVWGMSVTDFTIVGHMASEGVSELNRVVFKCGRINFSSYLRPKNSQNFLVSSYLRPTNLQILHLLTFTHLTIFHFGSQTWEVWESAHLNMKFWVPM